MSIRVLYKYAYSNRMTQERKLYVLMAIAIPIIVSATILALVGGYLRATVDAVIGLVTWSVGVLHALTPDCASQAIHAILAG